MTDKVEPSQGAASSHQTSGAIKWAAHGDWIAPTDTDYLASVAGLTGTPLNAFGESHSSSSYDVTIDTGEAFIGGRWTARDTQTTVTLSSSTNGQVVYAGWAKASGDTAIVGKSGAFSSNDRKVAIWEFDSDGSGVTAARDRRPLGEQVNITNARYETSDGSGTAVDDAAALGGDDASQYVQVSRETATIPMTQIPNGEDAIGLQMFVPSGKTLNIWRAGVIDENAAGIPSGLYIEVYDINDSTTLISTNSKHAEGEPLASTGSGAVSMHVHNATGSQINASGYVTFSME